MGKTEDNLKAAFAGESQANRKYLAFAQKADEEGFPEIAKLFRLHADHETAHALAHLKRLGVVKSTKENLEAAIAGETGEYTDMYPLFAQQAREEGDESTAAYFDKVAEAEKNHAEEYYKALKKMEGKTVKWRCEVCGYIHTGEEPPSRCPRCGAGKDAFIIAE